MLSIGVIYSPPLYIIAWTKKIYNQTMTETEKKVHGYGEEQFRKVSFDARIHYYKVVEEYMKSIAKTQAESSLEEWFRLIVGLASIIKPFIQIKDKQQIETSIDELRKKIRMRGGNSPYMKGRKVIEYVIDVELQKLTDQVYQASKHMLLPFGETEDEEFDVEAFMKRSGV